MDVHEFMCTHPRRRPLSPDKERISPSEISLRWWRKKIWVVIETDCVSSIVSLCLNLSLGHFEFSPSPKEISRKEDYRRSIGQENSSVVSTQSKPKPPSPILKTIFGFFSKKVGDIYMFLFRRIHTSITLLSFYTSD